MKFSNLFYLILFTLFATETIAQLNIYTFEQVDSLQQVEARPTVVFIQTDWCRYCKAMEHTTLQNEALIQELNDNFYFINLNGEEERAIAFKGHTFYFKPTGNHTGVHELAEQLGTIEGKLSYPTLAILNEEYELVFQYGSFLKTKILKNILAKSL